MRTVLIVDDEPIARSGIRGIVSWHELGFSRVLEAGDGTSALTVLENDQVDLLVADIVMDKLDGIRLVKEAQRRNPDLKAVLVTSFENFDTARRALRSGAAALIAKRELDAPTVTKTLRELFPNSDPECMLAPNVVDRSRSRTLEEALRAEHPTETTLADALGMVLCIWFPSGVDWSDVSAFLRALRGPGVYMDGEHLWVMTDNDDPPTSAVVAELQRYTLRSRHAAAAAYARTSEGAVSLSAGVRALRRWIDEAFWDERRGTVEVPFVAGGRDLGWTYAEQDRLDRAFHCEDGARFAEAARRFAEECRRRQVHPLRYRLILDNIVHSAFAQSSIGESQAMADAFSGLRGATQLQEYIAALRRVHAAWHAARTQQMVPEVVERALSYIREQLPRPVRLDDLSRHCAQSPSSISKLFHKHVGMTFRDYVALQRVQQSKQYLDRNPETSIADLAAEVGFEDVRQFNRIFRRLEGIPPSQYKAHMRTAS